MKTLIEFYDSNVIFNISAAVAMKPENMVFICGEAVSNKSKAIVEGLLSKYTPETRVKFMDVVMSREEQIADIFKKISDASDDCAIELTGGSELLCYYAGKYFPNANVFEYRPKSGKAVYLSGPLKGKTEKCRISLSIGDFAFMAGGRFLRHGHFDIASFGKDVFDDALKVWKVFIKYKSEWHKFVNFLQAVCVEDSPGYHGAKNVRRKDGSYVSANLPIINALRDEGIITSVRLSDNDISFKFKSNTIKELMNDFGVWLEMYIYRSVLDSGKFDSAEMSVILDWNDRTNETDDVFNEIDVIVTKGVTPLFISCKAGAVTPAALNEISVLSKRFGSDVAKAALVTTTDLSEVSAKLYKRAREMGVHVIDLSDLADESPADLLERIMING